MYNRKVVKWDSEEVLDGAHSRYGVSAVAVFTSLDAKSFPQPLMSSLKKSPLPESQLIQSFERVVLEYLYTFLLLCPILGSRPHIKPCYVY